MLGLIEPITGGEPPGVERGSPDFEPSEFARRYARLQALMERSQIDAVVLSQPANVRYFTGFRTWFWALPPVITIVAILPRDPAKATLIDTSTERGGIEQTTWIEDPLTYSGHEDPFDVIRDALSHRGLSNARLGLELGSGSRPHMSPLDLDRLRSLAPHAEWIDASLELKAVRALKSDAEISRVRESVRLVQAGFRAACEALAAGVTEVDLTRVAGRAMLDAGAAPGVDSSILIFMAGPERYSQPLQPSTSRPIGVGELVSLDGGCVFDGYHSDFARCAVIGELPPRAADLVATTTRALEAAVAAITPGEPIGRAYAAAQAVLDEAGVGAAAVNPHSIGHSIGLEHWELPGVAPLGTASGDVRARPGMVMCVEPQIAGAHGDTTWNDGLFLLEEQVLVTGDGREVLTSEVSREVFTAP
jgi:Xaa-Pro dipeptidase